MREMKIEIEIPDAVYKFVESLFGVNTINVIEKKITEDIGHYFQIAKESFA